MAEPSASAAETKDGPATGLDVTGAYSASEFEATAALESVSLGLLPAELRASLPPELSGIIGRIPGEVMSELLKVMTPEALVTGLNAIDMETLEIIAGAGGTTETQVFRWREEIWFHAKDSSWADRPRDPTEIEEPTPPSQSQEPPALPSEAIANAHSAAMPAVRGFRPSRIAAVAGAALITVGVTAGMYFSGRNPPIRPDTAPQAKNTAPVPPESPKPEPKHNESPIPAQEREDELNWKRFDRLRHVPLDTAQQAESNAYALLNELFQEKFPAAEDTATQFEGKSWKPTTFEAFLGSAFEYARQNPAGSKRGKEAEFNDCLVVLRASQTMIRQALEDKCPNGFNHGVRAGKFDSDTKERWLDVLRELDELLQHMEKHCEKRVKDVAPPSVPMPG